MIARNAPLLLSLALIAAAPGLSAQDTTGLRRSVAHGVAPMPKGTMTPDDVKALGNRFAKLKVIPESVAIGVGDTLFLGALQFMAVDSQGAILGRLPMVNTRMPAGAATLLLFQGARGVRPGVSIMTVTVPRPFWFRADDAAPAAQVTITVHK